VRNRVRVRVRIRVRDRVRVMVQLFSPLRRLRCAICVAPNTESAPVHWSAWTTGFYAIADKRTAFFSGEKFRQLCLFTGASDDNQTSANWATVPQSRIPVQALGYQLVLVARIRWGCTGELPCTWGWRVGVGWRVPVFCRPCSAPVSGRPCSAPGSWRPYSAPGSCRPWRPCIIPQKKHFITDKVQRSAIKSTRSTQP